ncbi:hypothetical protein CRX72_15680 [Pantoea sp. BRM17]|nr:hypothetical protein CRX72_15680 [Pantoea sp. BRM17]
MGQLERNARVLEATIEGVDKDDIVAVLCFVIDEAQIRFPQAEAAAPLAEAAAETVTAPPQSATVTDITPAVKRESSQLALEAKGILPEAPAAAVVDIPAAAKAASRGLRLQLVDLKEKEPELMLEELSNLGSVTDVVKGTHSFTVLQETTHILENILDGARRGEMQLSTDIINLFLETKDIMQEQLDAYKTAQEPNAESFNYICEALPNPHSRGDPVSMDISDFYQTFFDEADELLADMEQHLLGLDPQEPDAEQLNAIFRAAHSIKGGAGTFGMILKPP